MSLAEQQLLTLLSRQWWVLLLRGILALAFGLLAGLQPGIALAALILLFGVYALVDGILNIVLAISGRREHGHWWLLLLGGAVGVIVGAMTFLVPKLTALVLLLYIAAWAIASGMLAIVAALKLRREIEGEGLYVLGGIAAVVFGVFLLAQPTAGALSLVWLISAYALFSGVLLVWLAFRMRRLGRVGMRS